MSLLLFFFSFIVGSEKIFWGGTSSMCQKFDVRDVVGGVRRKWVGLSDADSKKKKMCDRF